MKCEDCASKTCESCPRSKTSIVQEMLRRMRKGDCRMKKYDIGIFRIETKFFIVQVEVSDDQYAHDAVHKAIRFAEEQDLDKGKVTIKYQPGGVKLVK